MFVDELFMFMNEAFHKKERIALQEASHSFTVKRAFKISPAFYQICHFENF